jgi:hypothetical protein
LIICETISDVVINICTTIIACVIGATIEDEDKDDEEKE